MSDLSNLLDGTRSACLCDVGQPGYIAAVVIADDGTEHLALALRDGIGDDDMVYDRHCADVGHEQAGQLPGAWRERIWGALARCGRPTAAGQPCRRMVSTPGEPCRQHRGLPKASERPPRQRYPRAVCPHCGANVAVAPKRRTFTPHWMFIDATDIGWPCPMSGKPAEVESS